MMSAMIDKKNNNKLLGISEKQEAILNCLEKNNSLKVSVIARLAKIPRTSVAFLLKKLRQRGFVKKIKIGHHYEWQWLDIGEFKSQLQSALNFFGVNKREVLGLVIDKKISVEIHRGLAKTKESYKKILNVGRNDRVYAIQGLKSAQAHLQKIEKEYFFDFHKILKKKRIIMEVVSGKSILNLFHNLSQKELESHFGRLIIAYFVPDSFVDTEIDIIMFGDDILFIDLKEEISLHIKNQFIAAAFKNLFISLKEKAIKIDLNFFIKELLSKKEEKIRSNE